MAENGRDRLRELLDAVLAGTQDPGDGARRRLDATAGDAFSSRTTYYTASSLDGFVADEQHSLAWLLRQDQDESGPLNYGDFFAGSAPR